MRHINFRKQRSLLLIMLGLGLVWLLNNWQAGFAVKPVQDPLPQDPYIQVYFNQNQSQVYTDPYRRIKRYGDDLEQVIIDAIVQAQSSIDVAVQEVNLPRIALALRDRAQAGVQVRVIVENQYNRVWQPLSGFHAQKLDERQQSKHQEQQQLIDANRNGKITAEELEQGDAMRILTKAQVPLLDDTADGSKGSGLMHHKFLVIDGQTVVVGSANWTLSGVHGDFAHEASRGNANGLLQIKSSDLAAVFTEEFELMWGDGPKQTKDSLFGLQKPLRSPQNISIPGSQVTVQFSPVSERKPWSQSVNGLISKTLAQAKQRVDLALFVFSDQGISDRLAQISQTGVDIRALVDSNFIYRSYSEALDMLGTALPDHRCKLEANNHPWTQPLSQVGTPMLPEGDKLHHKFALIDNHTVIMGSHNWSAAANHNNDEDVLIIRNPTVAAHFRREFDRLAVEADMGFTETLQERLQRQRKVCGRT
ncbi:MAG: phospholipase D-like domain-containing protein [Cyanobacteria bacterium J06639_14]